MRNLIGESQRKTQIYGCLVEFTEPEPLVRAAQAAYASGIRALDAFTPFPVEELPDAMGFKRDWVGLTALIGGISGGLSAFGMEVYANVYDYPINVGGRPFYSWPAFIPVTFELTVLGAALSAAFGMLAFNKLPQLWHPVFNAPEFVRASKDRFFLCILARDKKYDAAEIQRILKVFNPESFREVTFEE